MKKNVGTVDKIVRTIVALVIAILFEIHVINGLYSKILVLVALAFLLTSIFGFCPVYTVLGVNTFNSKVEY